MKLVKAMLKLFAVVEVIIGFVMLGAPSATFGQFGAFAIGITLIILSGVTYKFSR